MTDLEISKALALAIGYLPEHIREYGVGSVNYNNGEGVIQVFRHDGVYGVHRTECNHLWNNFQYEKWNVIGPIAAKLIVELIKCKSNQVAYWQATRGMEDDLDHCIANGDTPQKAIAMAVIGAKK